MDVNDDDNNNKTLVEDLLLVIQLMTNRDGLELLLRRCFYQHLIECRYLQNNNHC